MGRVCASPDCKSEKNRSNQYRYARNITSRNDRGICTNKEWYDNETLLQDYQSRVPLEKVNAATRAHGYGLLRVDETHMLGVASFA